MAAAEPIRKKDDVRKMAEYWLAKGSRRNYLLIFLGVYSALRISDLLSLTWDDIYDFKRGRFKKHITMTEQKTGKRRAIFLNGFILRILRAYRKDLKVVDAKDCLFSGRDKRSPVSRVRAWSVIKEAAKAAGVSGNISCHSLRKTFGYHAWQKKVSVAVIMEVFNHSSFAVTRRYLGIAQDELDRAQNTVFSSWRDRKKRTRPKIKQAS
ncbi:MAG: tyrosine-type recombinase/integrase [Acidaminococcales bacterium]|jgi:integrase|nr:tyrosine-type recombinase/integrase [Acidaminococcales bacterium]